MDPREYLQQIRNINLKIQLIYDEISEIKALLGVQAINYERAGTLSSSSGDKVARLVLKLIDKQNELLEQYVKLQEKKAEIRETVYQLDDSKQIELLIRRYFNFQRWEQIADSMNYSRRQITRLHGEALNNIGKIIKMSQNVL